jgi:NADH:ubiquinone oxidoreductase subunit C
MSGEKKPEKPKAEANKVSSDSNPTLPAKAKTPSSQNVTSSPSSIAKEPEPPKFEKSIVTQITERFGDQVKVIFIRPLRIKILVEPASIIEVASFLRDTVGFDHAESAGGTDYPKDNQIEMIYHLSSYTREELGPQILFLSVRTNRDDARLPSLIDVFKSVEYHERETFEMLGIYFEGHPRNDRFLLPEDWADLPPLRKDFRIKGR